MVGLGGLEPPTSPLSGARSSHLSYRPQHRRGTVHKCLIVQWLSVFRNCAESALRYKTATSPVHLLCTISESEFRPIAEGSVRAASRCTGSARKCSVLAYFRSTNRTTMRVLEDKLLKRNEPYSLGIELRTTPRLRLPEPITQNNSRPASLIGSKFH